MSDPEEALSEEDKSIHPNDTAQAEKDPLVELQQQVAEFREKYLRGLADSENQRKRLQKERQELVQYAVQGAILDFLSPIDHFENALKFASQASDEIKHWAIGFQMILGQFKEALTNNGVTPFSSVGQPFDPHYHEAVEMITTTEYEPGIVVEESLQGYKMGEKIIRPARVKVSKKPPEDLEVCETNQETNEI